MVAAAARLWKLVFSFSIPTSNFIPLFGLQENSAPDVEAMIEKALKKFHKDQCGALGCQNPYVHDCLGFC